MDLIQKELLEEIALVADIDNLEDSWSTGWSI